jgi:6-phosphogluconolactonase
MKSVLLAFTCMFLPALTPVAAETWNVYFGTGGPGARGIYHATFNTETGRLTPAELAAEIGSPGFLAVHPGGRKLYAVANFPGGPGAVGYQVNPDGSLTLMNTSPTGDGGGAHIAVHPSARFLLTAQYGGGSVALFPLDDEGRLGTATITRHEGGSRVVANRQNAPHPHWCGFSPDGRFIYLLNELSLSVTTFEWDAARGSARQLATVPTLSEEVKAKEAFNSAAEILVHPGGRFVYSSNRGHDTVTAFRAEPGTGALEVLQVQPVRGAFPRNINLSPGGGWLLAAGADSNTVSVHQVNPASGELTYQTRGIINVPAPICIVFAP